MCIRDRVVMVVVIWTTISSMMYGMLVFIFVVLGVVMFIRTRTFRVM